MLAAFFLLAGCSPAPQLYQERIYIFGTLVDVSIWGVDEAKARAATAKLAAEFQREHKDWHAWKPGALTELNAAIARGEAHQTLPSIVTLLRIGENLYTRSQGLFNPAIGGLIGLWGFHADEPPHGPPPPKAAIAAWLDNPPGMDDLTIDGLMVSSRNPKVQLDFGGFAKGYAVDRAIDELKALDIENAIVNAGGDLRAIGRRGDRPWRVGVRHPQGEGVLAALEVSGDECVFTSGNYERYNEYEGVHYAHILDPRTGMPVQGITSVTVLAHDGTLADAAATALVVAGAQDWPRIAKSLGVEDVMLVEESGMVHMTPSMAARVEFTGAKPPVTITTPR